MSEVSKPITRSLLFGLMLALAMVLVGLSGKASAQDGSSFVLAQEDDGGDDGGGDDDGGGQAPVGGVETGAGGTADSGATVWPFIAGGFAALLATGMILRRRLE